MRSVSLNLCGCALTVILVAGCTGRSERMNAPAAHHHVHGPHDGELIELGKEEYHAELLDDDERGTVTIYILDKEAKEPVPIAEEAIKIKMEPRGNTVEFRLPAKPPEGNPAGKCPRFESSEKDLRLALKDPDAKRRLEITIDGRPFEAVFPYYEPEKHHFEDAKP